MQEINIPSTFQLSAASHSEKPPKYNLLSSKSDGTELVLDGARNKPVLEWQQWNKRIFTVPSTQAMQDSGIQLWLLCTHTCREAGRTDHGLQILGVPGASGRV